MGLLVRAMIVLAAAAVVAQCVLLCRATGARAFTRYPSEEIARMNTPSGLGDLFGEATPATGPDGETTGRVLNTFAFGWLPSGSGRDLPSVITIGGPAALSGLAGLFARRRKVVTVQRREPQPK